MIEPKRLQNPILASKTHVRLHKELKLTHARYVQWNLRTRDTFGAIILSLIERLSLSRR